MSLGLYLRLSLADGDIREGEKDESNSIENQRELLRRYVEASDDLFGEIIEYVDDGYTGTNFDRPAFRQMIEDAKKGKISTIITKDLSRLGRDYIGVGDYLEQIFPVLGVRYIAVNSNYDSKAYSGTTMGLDMQVNNLINHLYSRDISKKIKSAVRTKWKQGKSTAGRLPFGYRKDKDARGGWAVDEEAAKTVRLIFELAAGGSGTKQIAEFLNEQEIITPGVYREQRQKYGGTRIVPDKEALWDTGKVRWILGKYEYTGAFVHNYRESVQVGSRVTRKVPEHERIVTEDAHDAIITKEQFYDAQGAVRFMRKSDYKIAGTYLLRGKVRCGNCHLVMAHHELAYDGVFYCHHKKKSGEQSDCCGEYISQKTIEWAVYIALRKQLWQIQYLKEQTELENNPAQKDMARERKALESKIDVKQAERVRQYVAYAEGLISLDKYLEIKEQLSQEIEALQRRMKSLQDQQMENRELAQESDSFFKAIEESMTEDKLTQAMVDAFIDTVYVYDPERIEVIFTFEDILAKMTEALGSRCEYEAG